MDIRARINDTSNKQMMSFHLKRFFQGWFALSLLFGSFLLVPEIRAQEEAPETTDADEAVEGSAGSPLGARQKRVKRLMAELESEFAKLSSTLEADNPDQALRLASAYKQARKLLLQQRMTGITDLLDDAMLENASREQQAVLGDLQTLLTFLLTEDELALLMKQIKELEEFQGQINKLVKEEKELKSDSEVLENQESALEKMAQQIAKLEELIQREKAVEGKAAAGNATDLDAVDAISDEQRAVRQETVALANDVAGPLNAAKPGVVEMREATKDQTEVERFLSLASLKPAAGSGKEAVLDLEKALRAMKEEQARVEAMDDDTAGELASKQDATGQKTEKLAQEMSKSAQAEEIAEAQKGAQDAKKSMAEASENLGDKKPGEAAKKQQQAINDLEQSDEELQKRINELRDQAAAAQLAALEKIFTAMLLTQKFLYAETVDLDVRKQANGDKLKRSDRLSLRRMADGERKLSKTASEAEAMLSEDGTSVVFQQVVGNLVKDLDGLAGQLDAQKTGKFAQHSQEEVIQTLEELIEALKNAQENREQQQQKQEQQQQQPNKKPPPLLPDAAELKLLRLHQLRINRRTEAMAEEAKGGVDELLKKQFGEVASRQGMIEELATAIAERLAGANNPNDGMAAALALVGKPAPKFELDLLAGGKFNLEENQGKIVILDLWATWCQPCTFAMPKLMKVAEKYKDQGVILVAVNKEEEPDTIKDFVAQLGWDLTVALDSDGALCQLYRENGIPQTVIIDAQGVVKKVHIGATETLEEQISKELDEILAE